MALLAGRAAVRRRLIALPLATGLLVTVLAGCGGTTSASSHLPIVRVTLEDFHITVSNPRPPAGEVQFVIHNRGPSTHEFNLIRTNRLAQDLPIAADGISVNENGFDFLVNISEVDIGTTRTVDVRLRPGHYVIYCNMPGHYMGGMRVNMDVA